ncbi:MAG TPA: VWA domain-containing protein, partial [Anaeromyxobacter sp.]
MTPPAPLPEPALAFGFLGYALRLADPGALRLLLAVLALGLLGALALARRRRALLRAAGSLAPRVAPEANRTRPAARLGLSLLGLALLAVALARPQCGSRTELAKQYGVDLALVLDASRSMLAADVKPDRLARAKLELGSLIDGLAGDRVGLVVFAGEAFVACPLTSDHAAAKLFLRAVEPDALPRQGTALARALATARDVLLASESRARSKVVLVVSDGEDHEGGVASAAQALAQDGIRLFALAVGTPEGAPVPPREGGRARREPVITRLDLASLRLLADRGDGDVYDVSSRDHGLPVFRAVLDRMARSELDGRVTVTYEDRYALAAFPGFLLLLGAMLLREGRAPGSGGRTGSPGRRSPQPGDGSRRPRMTPTPTSTSTPAPTPTSTSTPTPKRAEAPRNGAAGLLAVAALLLPGFSPFQAEERNVQAGNARLREGDAAGARRAYEDGERAVGAHPEIDFDRGNAAASEGRLDDARAAWGRAAAAAPAPLASRALQNLGNALAAAGDREGAVRAFSDALVKDPSNDDARWNLEVLLRNGKDGPPPRPPSPAAAGGQKQDRPSSGEREERRAGERKEAREKEGEDPREEAGKDGKEKQPEGERQEGSAGPRREPLSRQETEALLDALRARERHMPFFGQERTRARS